jgi:hypothetical protein
MANEYAWGYTRIMDELKKLGIHSDGHFDCSQSRHREGQIC